MYQYPKQILTIAQQIQSYIDAGMVITSREDVEKALKSVGFYRLRGYSFHLYDNATKKYVPGTKFEDILRLYQFDQELSSLIFSMISKIEVALRVRLVEALLIHGEPLIHRFLKRKNCIGRICLQWRQKLHALMMCLSNTISIIMRERCLYGQLLKFFHLVRYRR